MAEVTSWLLTDLYQLTMAKAYWASEVAQHDAAFHLFFRHNPFGGGYALVCGLEQAIAHIERARPEPDDLEYLAGLRGSDGARLFDAGFLDHLEGMELRIDVDAMPEGTVAFAYEPLLRVTGPIVQCQLLESALSNLVNFQTLIATKAARVCQAARGDPVLEFGLRRAQGPDGALSVGRAAWVGGCAATSNVEAGKVWNIPVRGTHAHSSVMIFDEERRAFEAFAAVFPAEAILLVDTYDTRAGTRNAVQVGKRLREAGGTLRGVRLDSGDLDVLSRDVRQILDDGGFPEAIIVASNELDEHRIEALKRSGAPIDAWGVGTRLATGHDDPALSGVYKLSAVRAPGGRWTHRVKVSEQAEKSTIPGLLQVRRFENGVSFSGDWIYDVLGAAPEDVDAADVMATDLLVPVFRAGKRVYDPPSLDRIRARARTHLAALPAGVKKLVDPDPYPVVLERSLEERRTRMIAEARSAAAAAPAAGAGDSERP